MIHNILVMLSRRMTQFSMQRTNLVCSILSQSWYRFFYSYWIQSNPTKNKTALDMMSNVLKFVQPVQNLCVIDTDNFLVKTCLGIMTSQPQHSSKTHGIDENAVRRVKEGTSAIVVQSGLSEKWWREATACFCYLRNIQDKLSHGRSPYERRFGTPFDGPVIPFWADFLLAKIQSVRNTNVVSIQDISRSIHRIRAEFWRRSDWRLIIADWHDMMNYIACEFHVPRFKNLKKLETQKMQETFVFPCTGGSPRREGHAQRQTLRHQGVESFDAGRLPSTLGEARAGPCAMRNG